MPDALHDRAQDYARALLSIADRAGGHWPATARNALVASERQSADDEPLSAGILLLQSLQDILDRWQGVTIGSSALLQELLADEDGPWLEWRRGQPITTRGIARLLDPYGIRPTRDRKGRFYRVADLRAGIETYLDPPSDEPSQATQASPKASQETHHKQWLAAA